MCSHWSGALPMRWTKKILLAASCHVWGAEKKKPSKMRLFIESDKKKFKKCSKNSSEFLGQFLSHILSKLDHNPGKNRIFAADQCESALNAAPTGLLLINILYHYPSLHTNSAQVTTLFRGHAALYQGLQEIRGPLNAATICCRIHIIHTYHYPSPHE